MKDGSMQRQADSESVGNSPSPTLAFPKATGAAFMPLWLLEQFLIDLSGPFGKVEQQP